jgi:quercetin dioxygenase-like cupin family protein
MADARATLTVHSLPRNPWRATADARIAACLGQIAARSRSGRNIFQRETFMRGKKRRAGIDATAVMLLTLLALQCAMAATQEPAPISSLEVKLRKQILKNERLSAYLLEIPPKQASLMHRHATDLLSIFVSGGETRSTISGNPPKEDSFAVGAVRFRPAGFTHSTENIGANMFRAVVVEFNSSVGAIEAGKPDDSHYCNPGTERACVDVKYLFCTASFCIQDVRIAPHAVWRNDNAGDRLRVAISDYQFSKRLRKSGEVEYISNGSAKQWKNIGDKTARVAEVVFR